ncbi:MAG: ABC transporter permease, partial [Actinomycetota bacterium]|nr:ABC transporter permease [Actinomycetota bacterium]
PDADKAELADGIDEATGGGTSSLTEDEAISALPGVASQERVFNQIIGLTVLIAIIVVALFFALITVERIGLYGVLKALGAGSGRLFGGVLLQAVIVTLVASLIGAAAALALAAVIPVGSIPFTATGTRIAGSAFFLLFAAVIGCAFSLRRVLKVDPAQAIGGGQ